MADRGRRKLAAEARALDPVRFASIMCPEPLVILQFNYEELTALKAGARGLLDEGEPEAANVLAPPERRARVEAFVSRLDGDITLASLADVRDVESALDAVVEWLRAEMELALVATHPADERAVVSYFDFAHAFTVHHRVREMAAEMAALIELMTGEPPTPESARSIQFPD